MNFTSNRPVITSRPHSRKNLNGEFRWAGFLCGRVHSSAPWDLHQGRRAPKGYLKVSSGLKTSMASAIYSPCSHSRNLWFESKRCRSLVLLIYFTPHARPLVLWFKSDVIGRYVSAGDFHHPPIGSGSWERLIRPHQIRWVSRVCHVFCVSDSLSTEFKTVCREFPLKATCGRAAWKCKISFVPLMEQIIPNTSTDLLLWYYAVLGVLSVPSLITYIIFHTISRNTVSLTNVMVCKALFMSSVRYNKVNSGLMY